MRSSRSRPPAQLVTAVIIVLCFVASVLAQQMGDTFKSARFANGDITPVAALLGWTWLMNTAILVFNLVPAFPLDGGRIARAIAWKRTGDRNRATRITAIVGQWFAYLVIGFGVFVAIKYHDLTDGILFAILGFFMLRRRRRPAWAARSPSAWRASRSPT